MVRIDYLIFGYFKACAEKDDIGKVATHLMSAGLGADISLRGEFLIPCIKFKEYKKALIGVSYEIKGPYGLSGIVNLFRFRKGLMFGFAVSLLILIFSATLLWDVRIEGLENLDEEYVLHRLESLGLKEGAFLSNLDLTIYYFLIFHYT